MAGVRILTKEERDLRDGIAIVTLVACVFRGGLSPAPEISARECYAHADAMLKARGDGTVRE